MKKCLALTLAAVLAASTLAGCGGGSTTTAETTTAAAASAAESSAETTEAAAAAEREPGSVNLSIMLALGQWTDNFDSVIEDYKKDNPQIGTIEYEFPSSSTYWDLLKGYLSAGTMPDIFGCGFGEQIENWNEYLADLSDLNAAADLTDEQVAMCSLDGKTIQVMPMVMEGWGILYNMKYLNQVGWEKTPETISELEQLCKDLEAAGIQPFIHHYAETSLSLTNHLGSTWITVKDDPLGYFEELKSGKDMNLAEDEDLNAMLDYYDLVLQYGNDDVIATDKWTGRNSFFLEEGAMVDDEGSWEIPNIMDVNPDLADHVVQGLVPISDDASKNKLQTASICAAVYKDSPELEEAKKFLDYLTKSDYTAYWHQDVMGNIPCLSTVPVSENLACLGQDVFALMQDGKTHEVMTPWTPDEVKDSLGEVWSLYVGKQIDRAQFFEQYQAVWTNYAANK
ncbi:MAG: ABC transporter substrate-binding protein [Clostridiales bacterium]|nr:ABC transporter substrate-binding protein [Clostridiales bacterium]